MWNVGSLLLYLLDSKTYMIECTGVFFFCSCCCHHAWHLCHHILISRVSKSYLIIYEPFLFFSCLIFYLNCFFLFQIKNHVIMEKASPSRLHFSRFVKNKMLWKYYQHDHHHYHLSPLHHITSLLILEPQPREEEEDKDRK